MNGILRTMAGLLLVGAAMASSGAQAAWGAIAYSQSTGAAGWSYDAVNEVDAEIRALNNCGKYASDCETAVTFRNGCGALAVGSNGGWGADWAPIATLRNPMRSIVVRITIAAAASLAGSAAAELRKTVLVHK